MKSQEAAAGATYLRRYEQKYVLNEDRYQGVMELLGGNYYPDIYGKSIVYSVYYDTSDNRIIRKAFTKGGYREKLRLRSYGAPEHSTETMASSRERVLGSPLETGATVYVELKKKYRGLTYKRRFPVSFGSFDDSGVPPLPSPEKRGLYAEFAWFYRRYDLSPAFFIRYDRLALRCTDNPTIRITFDTNICFRRGGFTSGQADGLVPFSNWTPILSGPYYLMELKTVNAIPLDLSRGLSRAGIFSVSFSKSKIAYQLMVKPKQDRLPWFIAANTIVPGTAVILKEAI
ncbi:MAG: polyphosphate polymerase domain-containing protein [Treponema sp.]|jgi:hypothetical protein|nr:polyphosphate polymerase domain-containing protein [Treponema sp.]